MVRESLKLTILNKKISFLIKNDLYSFVFPKFSFNFAGLTKHN